MHMVRKHETLRRLALRMNVDVLPRSALLVSRAYEWQGDEWRLVPCALCMHTLIKAYVSGTCVDFRVASQNEPIRQSSPPHTTRYIV